MFNERENYWMNKKLLAVAVAGALALPGVALAQSSVTISGFLKMSFGQYKLGNMNSAARPAGTNNTESRLTDDSSRIVFNIREDLGGGVSAIAQVDWRIAPDSAADGGGPTGNNHIGLRSATWGQIIFGRQDMHYGLRESNLTAKGDLKSDSISLLAYVQSCNVASVCLKRSIANATRTPNAIYYRTPTWGGLDVYLGYSTNPLGAQEGDIGSTQRKGSGYNVNPVFNGGNWTVGYSYWQAKQDAPTATTLDERGDRIAGSYRWGGLMVGLAWDKSKLKTALGGVQTNNRTAWSIPVQYTWGPHGVYGHYTEAKDDKGTAGGSSTGAKMYAITYAYDLSKRTSFAVNYAQIKNDSRAAYDFFTTGSGNIGTATSAVAAGEDPRNLTFTLRHAF